jgi:flagellar hook protein FlgE
MLGAIYVGLSGLDAYSKGLKAISNNVANLNTLGFKSSTVQFTDVFNHGGGGLTFSEGDQKNYVGGGVRFGEQQTNLKQGDLRQSGNDLDLAVQGNGFLVLLDGDKTTYARTGQFELDEEGFVILQGTEKRLAILGENQQPTTLNIDKTRISSPVATTKVAFADNLSSTGTEATVSNITVYDSNGGKQVWQVKFTAVGSTAPGSWNLVVTDQTSRQVGTGAIKFIGNTIDASTAKVTITDSPAGAEPLSVELDFSSVTGFSSGTTSGIRATPADGNGVGTLTGLTIDPDGQVKLTYSNAKTDFAGFLAVADFRSPQNLEQVGNGLFENNSESQFRLVASGVDGAGKVVSGQLEASNVDLSQEFGDLILIQRGFQASSQVVSVTNDMIQQLFGIRGQG